MTTTSRPADAPPRAVQFPAVPYDTAASFTGAYLDELAQAAASIDPVSLDRATDLLLEAYTRGNLVFSCGNGGSAAIANHLQCDHLKGVRTGTDLTPRVVSLSSNVEVVTAVSNDIGYDEVFSYQVQAQGRTGDVLIAVSSSGKSENIVQAIRCAQRRGMR